MINEKSKTRKTNLRRLKQDVTTLLSDPTSCKYIFLTIEFYIVNHITQSEAYSHFQV